MDVVLLLYLRFYKVLREKYCGLNSETGKKSEIVGIYVSLLDDDSYAIGSMFELTLESIMEVVS